MMKVTAICATSGRHTLLERAVGMFLEQDYEGPCTLLIYNNSDVKLDLNKRFDPLPPPEITWHIDENRRVHLINRWVDKVTDKPYTNLGAIYTDALEEVSEDTDIIIHWDDDDLYLPNHISEGVKGFLKAKELGKEAYKPQFSWFRHPQGVDLMSNNLEPSIFIDANYLKSKGYKLTTTDQHYGWYQPLLEEQKLFVDPKGTPTLIYNWGDTVPTFKTSGNAGDPNNFNNYRSFSRDHGDRIITPLDSRELEVYYQQVKREQELNKIVNNVS